MTLTESKTLFKVLKDSSFKDYDLSECSCVEEVIDYIRERITEEEVIYYSNAMNYLSNNDDSLTDSIGLAIEMGYSLENVNSELLATLLLQQHLMEELNELESEIEDCF